MAERKTVLAVPIFELFRARFRAAMAAFKVLTVSSRLVGRWGFVSMVEAVGSCGGGCGTGCLGGLGCPYQRCPFDLSRCVSCG